MRYNGGKTRIAKYIAPIVNAERAGRFCWEPFCGGLGMTEHLKPDLASDVHPGLIALYEQLRVDPAWLDGFECTEEIYRAAKAFPDDCPAKAFIGFGCSFGGKWFGGFGRGHGTKNNPYSVCNTSVRGLARKLKACNNTRFRQLSFFDPQPVSGAVLYLDPPYAGTTIAGASRGFDQTAFRARAEAWARAGSIVFVSEYDFPLGSVVWERKAQNSLSGGSQTLGDSRTEKLYRLAL